MRKILSILLTISIIFSCINFNVFAETEGVLSLSAPTSASTGETINVVLNIPRGTNALMGSLNLVYDNAALSVESCTSGTILSEKTVAINKTYSENTIRMSFDGDTPLKEGGTLLNISFKILSGASGIVLFDVEKFKLLDENYNSIDIAETVSAQMYIVNDAETKVTINCNDTVKTGEEIIVTVDIVDSLNVCGGGFNLVYDASKFSVSSATVGSVLSAFTKQLNKSYASNKIRLTWAGHSSMAEDGTLLTVKFIVKDSTSGEGVFSIEKLSFGDLNGSTHDGAAVPANIKVVCTHNIMSWVVTDEASCNDTGVERYMCGCGYTTDERELSATGHEKMEWVITKEATCDDRGLKEYTCKSCGFVEKTEEIPAHGHIYESVVTPPTQSEKGFTTHTCSGCGHSYTDTPTEATGYTISYDANGGTGAPESQTKYHNETVILSDDIPTREGYEFLGWTKTSGGSVAEFTPGGSYIDNVDAILYAVWSANEHTITYVVDGKSYSVQSYNYGTAIDAIAEPSKKGYTFSGWSEIPVTMPDNDITITGSFTINTYSVSFDANNDNGIFKEYVISYGTTMVIPEEIPTLESNTFIGWSTSKTARKAQYYPNDKIEVKENVTLYAVWNQIWDGTVAETFAGGNGTITNPYRIENASQLFHMANKINSGEEGYASAYYIMTNNISLNDISNVDEWATKAPANEWIPIGTEASPFKGTFDGNGYTISGLYINQYQEDETGYHKGLFGFVVDGTISNLGIEKGYFKAYRYSGVLVGGTYGATIKNCYNKIPVVGDYNIGGLIGAVDPQVSSFTMEGCYNEGLIDVGDCSGGLIGVCLSVNPVNIDSCYNLGNVSGINYVGGIVGIYNTKEAKIVINNCYNKGNIDGKQHIGGIVGGVQGDTTNENIISNCYNTGSIYGTSNGVGGIAGIVKTGNIKHSFNLGTISADTCDYAGICGYAGVGSTISNCYNLGQVQGNGHSAGGIGGAIYDGINVVSDCYNGGTINVGNKTWAAGISGYLGEGSCIKTSINYGDIRGASPVGGIAGYNVGTITDCYYLNTCGAAGGGTALTHTQMRSGANFSYYAISNKTSWKNSWVMGYNPYVGYPSLKGMENLMEIPIEFDLNGGYFDEYVFCASTISSQKNVERGNDYLVVYDNSNTTTGTNNYGYEVIVDNRNVVIALKDYAGDNIVPDGGFILSGHGMMDEWLQKNIELGDKVYYSNSNYEVKVFKKNPKFTFSYGFVSYLPTPYKEGAVFSGWYDEAGNLVTASTKLQATSILKLRAEWASPKVIATTAADGHDYIFFNAKTTYESAKRFCEQRSGHLVTINTTSEAAVIRDYAKSGKRYIIGADDTAEEGVFQWVTGEPFNYTALTPFGFSKSPGDATGNRDVLEVYKTTGCTVNNIELSELSDGFICEMDYFAPVGATTYNGHYYELFNDNISWEYAKSYCEGRGGHLVTITSSNEQTAITSFISEFNTDANITYWLGASDAESEGDWKWVTDEDWEYTNWNTTQPDNAGGKEHYVHIYTAGDRMGKWNDLPITYSNVGFICEYDEVRPIAEAEFNGHKYLVFDKSVTWKDAKKCCEFLGGYLATITSAEEDSFVNSLAYNYGCYGAYYIGGTDEEQEGVWKWVTGEPWDYKNWHDGEPNNSGEIEHYLVLWPKNSNPSWNDTTNDYSNGCGFICEIEPTEEDDIKSGMYENISWSLEDGILYLSGEGAITASLSYPWDAYDEIKSIIIAEGITDIGYAFSNLTNTIENIVIPKSITNFPENFGFGRIEKVSYSGSKYDFEKLIPADSTDFADSTITYSEYAVIYSDLVVKNVAIGESLTITSDIPEKENMIFVGWATQGTAATAEYVSGDKITPESDILLYPLWKESVTIKYDANGGINAPGMQSAAANEKIKISEQVPTLSGHIFLGWSDDIFSDSVKYLQGCEYTFSENITLYAVWKDGIEGSLDESVLWKIDNGILSINGTGKLSNFAQSSAPWYECKDTITRIVVEDDITSIGDYAFYGLDKVVSVDLGGVISIGDYAFSNCTSLGSIDTSKITEFGSYAFRYCGALTEITIDSDDVKYGTNVFSNCIGVTDVVVNDGTTKIPSKIFNNCGNIESISIPESVVLIEENAFTDTTFTNVIYDGTKDDFAELLKTKDTLLFAEVTCKADSKTYLYSDFFEEIVYITDIRFNKKSKGLYVGDEYSLLPEITPINATEDYSFASDNEAVATVDDLGKVTAVGKGIANITATSEKGLLSASYVIYVEEITKPVIFVSDLSVGKKTKFKIELRSMDTISGMIFVATYDKVTGQIRTISRYDAIAEQEVDIDTPNSEVVKVIWWDNLNGLRPLANSVIVNEFN